MTTVAVGLSGGVDSGTTALLLKEQGYKVIGVTMWLFNHQSDEIESAKRIASCLEIEHHILDYRALFKTEIIDAFVQAYELGQTPNPCIICNRIFKYGKLISDSLKLVAEYFATGHYAKSLFNSETGEYEIYRPENLKKDQTYNLYHLNQETLKHLIFPLGTMASKDQVRERFADYHLEIAEKKDSMGICFIEHKNHTEFLKEIGSAAMKRGHFLDQSGHCLGTHTGTANFTIGQKRRLGKDLKGQYLNGKYVVTALDAQTQTVVLGEEKDLLYHSISCDAFSLISPHMQGEFLHAFKMENKKHTFVVTVIVSQWSAAYMGQLSIDFIEDTSEIHSPTDSIQKIKTAACITFESPVRAPSKGQALVCYIENRLIGGGIITSYE